MDHRVIPVPQAAQYLALEDWCAEGPLAAIRKTVLRFFARPVPLLSAATLADLLGQHFAGERAASPSWPCPLQLLPANARATPQPPTMQPVLATPPPAHSILETVPPTGANPVTDLLVSDGTVEGQLTGENTTTLLEDSLRLARIETDHHYDASDTLYVNDSLNANVPDDNETLHITTISPAGQEPVFSTAIVKAIKKSQPCVDLSPIQHKLATDAPPSQTFLALIRLMPFIRSMFLELENPNRTLSSKFRAFSDRFCRLADLEAHTPGLESHLPFSCTLQDVVMSAIACQTSNATRSDCDGFPGSAIGDFPTEETCHAPLFALQRRAGANPRLRSFKWHDKVHLPLEMEDIRPVPSSVPVEIRRSEVLTYLALYRAIRLIYALVQNHRNSCNLLNSDQPLELIPGHRLQSVGWLNWTTEEIPFVFISRDIHNKNVLSIGLRGTSNVPEWAVDMNYARSKIKIPSEELLEGREETTFSPGTASTIEGPAGFADIVNEILGFVLEKVDDWLQSVHGRTKPVIMLYGHSLGGGVGNLLALALAKEFSNRALVPKSNKVFPRIDGVFFGAPVVLTTDLLPTYATIANVRNLIDIGDPLYYLPCHASNARHGHFRCPLGHISSTSAETGTRDEYHKPPGLIVLDIYNQPKQTPSPLRRMRPLRHSRNLQEATAMDLISMMPTQISREEIMEPHVNSFGCYLSEACRGVPWGGFSWSCPSPSPDWAYGDPRVLF